MQSVEMVTLLLITFVVSGLFIVFILGVDFNEVQNTFFDSTKENQTGADKKTSLNELALEIDKCWSNCAFGDKNLDCGVFYVINEEYLMEDLNSVSKIIAKLNLCKDCNLMVPSSELPAVVRMLCVDSTNDQIIIEK